MEIIPHRFFYEVNIINIKTGERIYNFAFERVFPGRCLFCYQGFKIVVQESVKVYIGY